MREITSIEDQSRGRVSYLLERDGDKHVVTMERRDVERLGAVAILEDMGFGDWIDTKRVNVEQRSQIIGTVPHDFDPLMIRSLSPLYDPRGGDFKRNAYCWLASPSLCPGDFDAIPGFVWNRQAK